MSALVAVLGFVIPSEPLTANLLLGVAFVKRAQEVVELYPFTPFNLRTM